MEHNEILHLLGTGASIEDGGRIAAALIAASASLLVAHDWIWHGIIGC